MEESDKDSKNNSESPEPPVDFNEEKFKYTALKQWAESRLNGLNTIYEQFPQYEENPQLVISEVQMFCKETENHNENEDFSLFNRFTFSRVIPVYACSVLLRDFLDQLKSEEKEFCKNTIIDVAALPLTEEGYLSQKFNGTEQAITAIPFLLKQFPQEKNSLKLLVLKLLFWSCGEPKVAAMKAILYLWDLNFDDAQSMFLGYLLLQPKYDKLSEELRQEHYKNFTFSDISRKDAFQHFLKRYKKSLDKIIANQIKYEDIKDVESFSLDILLTAFELIPSNTENTVHKNFISRLADIFSKELSKHPNKLNYMLRSRFFEKFAVVVLNSSIDEIKIYIKPFVENFRSSNDMSEFFETFVYTEDRLNRYEEFWIIWDLFYDKIVEISADTYYHSTGAIIRRYLLAGVNWKKDAKQWHSLKHREKSFYRKVVFDMGNHPSVLFSLSKLLNEIGSDFLADGIIWISDILQRNKNLFEEELETDTIFYLEKVVKKYVLTNRQEIKTIAQTKKRVNILLDFLIEKGSVMMYLLREEIM